MFELLFASAWIAEACALAALRAAQVQVAIAAHFWCAAMAEAAAQAAALLFLPVG